MNSSSFVALPNDLICLIFFHLGVPQLTTVLCLSKRLHRIAYLVLVEHFQRWDINPPRKRPFDNSCWVVFFELRFSIDPTLFSGAPRSRSDNYVFAFGGMQTYLSNYFLDGYTNMEISNQIYDLYDTLRDRRSKDMPLPTKSLSFILFDSAPMTAAERKMGYPSLPASAFLLSSMRASLYMENIHDDKTRTQYHLADFDVGLDRQLKQRLSIATPGRREKVLFERTFRPLNGKGQQVGSENMRFKLEGE
ncbi:hypothetical protein PUNSTDRAFT_133648 [Punctularia strigosozonata HHB-11173 SS5]|uniref:uncharacterized protein n=1 Tax=Punctularia strigosozonata (strain HHB-11173) TaxID=741275 RepID=UPI00044184DA|nr:uncharacterized protein PUNSTDRAFT_133648 [Punctularia strigosozonata HHB-11173 SS5]EIN09877.1 hypothetical protein PUNSTDRAFT_133648 [Punctularia strigosozonata HHB-11173 SS5]